MLVVTIVPSKLDCGNAAAALAGLPPNLLNCLIQSVLNVAAQSLAGLRQ